MRISGRWRAAAGITVVEVCGATVVVGVVTALALGAGNRVIDRQSQRVGTAELAAVLRETHQQAIAEERPLCVRFDLAAQTYSVLSGACGTKRSASLRGPLRLADGLRMDAASFRTGDHAGAELTFRADGSATPGTVSIARAADARIDTVVVHGATGAVS